MSPQKSIREALQETMETLIRIEEQMKYFMEKVTELDEDMGDVKKHVTSVRAVSRICVIILSASTCIVTILRLFVLNG